MRNNILLSSFIFMCLLTSNLYAQYDGGNLGRTIQITTRLHTWVGKPSWLLVIHDLDNNEILPYVFDIRKGYNFWIAFTNSRHYLITASTMRIETYDSYLNKFKMYKINDFCHLESHGRVVRGDSWIVNLSGNLSRYPDTIDCQVVRFPQADFTIVPLEDVSY